MATRTPKEMVATQQLTAAAASYYTVPTNATAEVNSATAVNTTGVARTVTVHIIPSAGAAATTNKIVFTKGIPANGSVQLWELFGAIAPGSDVQAFADAATAVNLRIAGYEFVS